MSRKITRRMQYDKEFRNSAVERVRNGEKGTDVARELGINSSTLGNWVARDSKTVVNGLEPANPVTSWKPINTDAFRQAVEDHIDALEVESCRLQEEVAALRLYLEL